MSWSETLVTAWHAIRAHTMRSLLTVLGILIGIAAVILTVGLGLGTQKDVSEDISSLGSNLLIVTPGSSTDSAGVRGGFGSASTLTVADAEALGSDVAVPDVAAVTAEKESSQSLEAGDANWTTTVTGVTGDWLGVRSRELSSGELVDAASTDEVVLGPETATELFGSTDVVGRTVSIAGTTFDVVGVLEAAGSSASADLDDVAVVSMTAMTSGITGGTDTSVSTIYLKATGTDAISAASQEAQSLLLALHGASSADAADFTIDSQDSLVSTATSVYRTLTVLLAGVAGLSLLVGGIGVMNIMLVSVTERIREIGLRKALGATPSVIRRQFLAEASLLGLAGGVVGIVIAAVGAWGLPGLIDQPVSLSLLATAAALVTSLALGVGFGVYPAGRAARLTPIDALRSE